MILPTSTTVAVADGETVRLFHNAGVKPEVHLVEITAAPPAPAADDPISTDNDLDVVPTLSRHHRSGLSYRAATRNAEVSWRTVAFEGG